ncbi:hypothetical protein [Vibrio gigantis]|uniref:Uncharacterized protein n=1 Tax=Vibrio gigantis TaxID=296199 RepID=A0A5M9NWW8_9VIBR|nr:hypothetical protein [Vibrio gigantis]KAA8675607.1 hypothetical protein F4W18_13350 [Vibrio gigantis]
MLGMNYVIPYAKHRTNTGSGAGVPLILKSKGLANGEGLYGDCFNLPIKQGGGVVERSRNGINAHEHAGGAR